MNGDHVAADAHPGDELPGHVLADARSPWTHPFQIRIQRLTRESRTLTEPTFCIRQLAEEIDPPESGKQSVVLFNDTKAKVVLFAFATGSGLAEHVAPFPAMIQIVRGEAALTIGDETVAAKPGTWLWMAAKTPHSIDAKSPVVMLLTLWK